MTQTQVPPPGAVVKRAGEAVMAKPAVWTNRETDLVASVIAPGLRGDEGALLAFAAVCKHTQLDPFARQIYAWKDGGKLTIHIAINGWRAIASRTGEYAGQDGPYWCGPDGEWKDVWISDKPPVAARVGVLRRGFDRPVYSVATWKEFGRPKVPIWTEKGAHMLAKCAEYNALQRGFPEAFDAVVSGLALSRPDIAVAASPAQVPDTLDTEAGRFIEAAEAREQTGEAETREGSGNAPAPPAEGEVSAPGSRSPDDAPPHQAATVPSGDGSETSSRGAESGAPPDAVADLPLPANANAEGAMEWWAALQSGAQAIGLTDDDMRAALKGVYSCSNAIGWCRSHHTTANGLLARAKELRQLS